MLLFQPEKGEAGKREEDKLLGIITQEKDRQLYVGVSYEFFASCGEKAEGRSRDKLILLQINFHPNKIDNCEVFGKYYQ